MERCKTSPEEVRSNVSLTCLNYNLTPTQVSFTNCGQGKEREEKRHERKGAIFLARPQSEIPELCE